MKLTKEELKRLDFGEIRRLIDTQEKRLQHLNGYMAKDLMNEICELKKLLELEQN